MGNFWADKLAARRPATRPAPTQQTAGYAPAQRPWWDTTTPPAPPPTQQQVQPEEQTAAKPTLYSAPANYQPPQAKGIRAEGICPDCQKNSLTTVPTMPNVRPRCTLCGWPVLHSTSGMNVPVQDGQAATPARQVSTANNYNPGLLIASLKSL